MKKLGELSSKELGQKRIELQQKLDDLRTEQNILLNKMTPILSKLKTINELLDSKTLNSDDPQALLEKFPETESRRKLFKEYVESLGLSEAGSYWVDTNQSCVRIALYKNNDEITKKAHDGILKILPYMKPLKDGKKTFDIFEHTLSRSYSYYLKVTDDKLFEVTVHTNDVWKSSEDLMEILTYIQKELYYEKNYPF